MTTPPKATKFRIRRAAPPKAPEPEVDDGFGNEPFPTSEQDVLADDPGAEDENAAIRAEGLTGRQLRMARRVAIRHGIEAETDIDAVRLLRKRGIDPFQRSNLLELVLPEGANADEAAPEARVQLPQTTRGTPNLPSTQLMSDADRAQEIMRMQRDIARRRRRNLMMLGARLAGFVLLPTLVAAIYYFFLATPFYATRSEFVIQQADAQMGGNIGSLFRGTQFATTQDSITVQSYLQSRDAMLRLDSDLGYRTHFAQDFIDPLQRLEAGATNEETYDLYRRNVKIGYDPTEGIIRMEVSAADPGVSQKFSEALIGYAEEQVDQMTQRLRGDQMKGARDSYEDAEAKVLSAQERVLALQEQLGVLDPKTEGGVVISQIATLEAQLQQKQLELGQLLDNAQPNQARVAGVKGDMTRLQGLIADLRAQLTEGVEGSASLASVTGQLRIAEADLQTRQLMLGQALQQLELARIEANRQTRYLELSVRPIAPDEPTYPRAFENTALAFLIFAGIYLMLSLTVSILREQATS